MCGEQGAALQGESPEGLVDCWVGRVHLRGETKRPCCSAFLPMVEDNGWVQRVRVMVKGHLGLGQDVPRPGSLPKRDPTETGMRWSRGMPRHTAPTPALQPCAS